MAGELTLEVVEGPDAGKQFSVEKAVVIGRANDADLVLDDGEVSRHHARVTPGLGRSATVEDLGSANGTFVNHNELVGPAQVDPGDQLLIGVTVIQLRTADEVRSQPSAVIQVPPGLRTAEQPPGYLNPEVVRLDETGPAAPEPVPELEKYLDVRVRRRAQLAPLALFVLIAIALMLYFALR